MILIYVIFPVFDKCAKTINWKRKYCWSLLNQILQIRNPKYVEILRRFQWHWRSLHYQKLFKKKLTSWRGKSSILIGSSSGVSVSPTRADSNVDPSGEKRRTASKGGRDKKSWNKQVYPISKEVKQVLLNTSRPLDRLQLNIISKTKVRETSWREQEETNLSSFIKSPPLTSSEDYL